jgi:hypothetical protein
MITPYAAGETPRIIAYPWSAEQAPGPMGLTVIHRVDSLPVRWNPSACTRTYSLRRPTAWVNILSPLKRMAGNPNREGYYAFTKAWLRCRKPWQKQALGPPSILLPSEKGCARIFIARSFSHAKFDSAGVDKQAFGPRDIR